MGLRSAINEKCRDCIYDKCAPGNWRQQVTACRITSCSLHEYRPTSNAAPKQAVSGTNGVQELPACG